MTAPDVFTPKPPPLTGSQRAVQLMCGVVLFGGAAAMFVSRHLPTQRGVWLSVGCAAAVSACTAWECRPGGAYDPARGAMNRMQRFGPLRIPLLLLFVFFVTFTFVEDGVLGAITGLAGAPGSRTLTVTGVSFSSKSCDHFRVADVGWLLDQALCAPDEELRVAKPGDQLVVFGRQSPFGLNVESHQLRPAAQGT